MRASKNTRTLFRGWSLFCCTLLGLTMHSTSILSAGLDSIYDEKSPTEPWHYCGLVPWTGPCRAFLPKWFYNVTSATCDPFIYGGCRGNRNRFEERSECISVCRPAVFGSSQYLGSSSSSMSEPLLRSGSSSGNYNSD
ncbi:hypothetical protein BV898_01315 [Hypsibius exemplaris]|uniref:BPTI/Kunitz inhibitor domain-containing protein n=1 Tax=Hypsibius exemplaris TaxID=2072580 RepID=A0A1W0XB35_HYPEX|nr:hypothetical protein BV898_01315 [Hypsibius exemplaris]